MLNVLLILICLMLMIYLTPHWYVRTAEMREVSRYKRMTNHLNWQPPAPDEEETGKKGRRKRR